MRLPQILDSALDSFQFPLKIAETNLLFSLFLRYFKLFDKVPNCVFGMVYKNNQPLLNILVWGCFWGPRKVLLGAEVQNFCY